MSIIESMGIPRNATNIKIRVLTADEKDKYIAQLEVENEALKKENLALYKKIDELDEKG